MKMDLQLTCRQCPFVFIFLFVFLQTSVTEIIENSHESTNDGEFFEPTVMIAVLVRNKAHTLPWFFGHLERLSYPKDRITLWIRSDHNIDNSSEIIREWTSAVSPEYHDIDIEIDESSQEYDDERGPCDWSVKRFDHVMKLREEALNNARRIWADYLFMLDADVILENVDTLNVLLDAGQTVVAPMLNCSFGGGYSNFWGGMSKEGYYERVEGYFDVVERNKIGVFEVPMVHHALLINMGHVVTDKFSYIDKPQNYKGPHDDIILFAHTVRATVEVIDLSTNYSDKTKWNETTRKSSVHITWRVGGTHMHIVNTEFFGIVMQPLDHRNNLQDEVDHFIYVKLEAIDADIVDEVKIGRIYPVYRPPLIPSPHVFIPEVKPDLLGFDQIYMINLKRRPDRRERMLFALKELGIAAKIMDAVDGKELNTTYLKKLGVEMMQGYLDPYHKRPLTLGEIGCFLSHYFIWLDMKENNYQRVIVFEDDVRFEAFFRKKIKKMLAEADESVKDWELLYLGRKRMRKSEEERVEGSSMLVWPSYSYWTLSYALSLPGADKLLNQKPLEKLIPVDEFLPIMFDRHPENGWKENFSPRNLIGLSTDPLLVYPTHYTGEPNYISDTEDSHIMKSDQEDSTKEKAIKEKEEL